MHTHTCLTGCTCPAPCHLLVASPLFPSLEWRDWFCRDAVRSVPVPVLSPPSPTEAGPRTLRFSLSHGPIDTGSH